MENGSPPVDRAVFSKEELKKRLTPLQYQVTQEKGTERAFTGKYYRCTDKGVYECVVCGLPLFSSETKYNSGCGWPAFWDVMEPSHVKYKPDFSHIGGNLLLLALKPAIARTEVLCSRCDAHLGHVFDDGPKPTGKRFCINSASLELQKEASSPLPPMSPSGAAEASSLHCQLADRCNTTATCLGQKV